MSIQALSHLALDGRLRVPAREVKSYVHALLSATEATDRELAQGVGMAEAQFNRLASSRGGAVKSQTLFPLRRVALLVEEGLKALSAQGLKRWLREPNAYLDDVPPILCLRSDKELRKVTGLLAAIRYGFPA